MLILGDVIATIALYSAVFGASLCLLMVAALWARQRSVRYSIRLREQPSRCFAIGALSSLLIVSFALVLLNINALRLVGFALLIAWIGFSLVGATGLVAMLADRLQAMDPQLSRLSAITRSSLLIVGACALPLLGTFFLMPALLCVGFGSALQIGKKRTLVAPEVS